MTSHRRSACGSSCPIRRPGDPEAAQRLPSAPGGWGRGRICGRRRAVGRCRLGGWVAFGGRDLHHGVFGRHGLWLDRRSGRGGGRTALWWNAGGTAAGRRPTAACGSWCGDDGHGRRGGRGSSGCRNGGRGREVERWDPGGAAVDDRCSQERLGPVTQSYGHQRGHQEGAPYDPTVEQKGRNPPVTGVPSAHREPPSHRATTRTSQADPQPVWQVMRSPGDQGRPGVPSVGGATRWRGSRWARHARRRRR